jgi:hypothetical protein
LEKVLPAMVPKMGDIYVNTIRSCLEGVKQEGGRSHVESVFLQVVRQIDQCRA